MSKLDELIEDYKKNASSLSHKEKALREKAVWDEFYHQQGKGVSKQATRRDWLYRQFGETNKDNVSFYDARAILINAGAWTDPLWAFVDKGLSFVAVLQIYRAAKVHSIRHNCSREEGLAKAVDDYNQDKTRRGKNRDACLPVETSDNSKEIARSTASRIFFKKVEDLAKEFMTSNLREEDPYLAKRVTEEFLGTIRIAYEEATREVNKYRRQSKEEKTIRNRVSRSSFLFACEVLNFNVSFGKPVDIEEAKKRARRRASALHPDKVGASENTLREYRQVIEALDTLKQYNQELSEHDRSERDRQQRS